MKSSKKQLSTKDLAENYNSLISLLPCHIYWKDKNGKYLGCNHLQAENLGFSSPNEIIGKTDFELPWSEQAMTLRETDQKVMMTKQNYTFEEQLVLANGKKSIFLSIKAPSLASNGKVKGIIGISFDITERKQIEEDLVQAKEASEAANKTKTEFLENMRHDIRTPLTGIVGFADMIKLEADNPQIKEYAENLVASSHALLHLLDDVLEAIRVSSGEIPRLKKKFDLKKTLLHIIELNRAKAAQKKLQLTFDFDSEIPNYVIGDKVRVHRIVLELIANALNFTDTGFIKLSAILAKRNQRELIIKLIVEDTGIGIPKEKKQEIYVQFKRLTPSYQGIYKGAGLGLSVVKQFIDELDGEIYVESGSKKGTQFTCIIPLHEPLLDDDLGIDKEVEENIYHPYEKIYKEQIKPIPEITKQHYQHHVLVVEDNTIAQTFAKSILTISNCRVDIAENGKMTVELWKTNNYDLVFMDIGLPDMDGYEVTHQIRVLELIGKSHTPIIALTAHAGDENKKRCIDVGMNAVLTKPLTAKNCKDIIDAFIPGQDQSISSETGHFWAELPEKEEDLFNLSHYPVLDIKEGMKTTGNEKILVDMLTLMIKDSLPKDAELMKKAYEENDWDKTQQLAHKIKGGAVYVGTVKIKMACQFLERYWKTGKQDLLEQLYQQTMDVIDESIEEIQHWLGHQIIIK